MITLFILTVITQRWKAFRYLRGLMWAVFSNL